MLRANVVYSSYVFCMNRACELSLLLLLLCVCVCEREGGRESLRVRGCGRE